LFLLLIKIQDLADALRSLDPLGDGTLTFDEFCRGVGSIIQQSPTGKTGIPIFPSASKPPTKFRIPRKTNGLPKPQC
jgi:hypothetical protein